MKIPYRILFLFLSFCAFVQAQDRVFVDFGSSSESRASAAYVNNIATSRQAGYSNGVLLFNQQGVATGINLQVHDGWLNVNTAGTTTPDHQLGFTANTSQDNFFGATGVFNGNTDPTGGFKLRQLDPNTYYSLAFFASRMNVTDNRETLYTAAGNITQTATLNASNNTSQRAIIYNMRPDANGEITITATAGGNNTNSSGFYYLSGLEIQATNAPISQLATQSSLELVYPIQNATWEAGKTVDLLWRSEGITTVNLEISIDGGSTFSTIATAPATDARYAYTVPNSLTSNAIIRISNGTQVYYSAPIEIIPDDGTVYKIVVLGSSTAAGSGPSSQYNAWVWKYRRYLYQLDTRYEVENLAQGGFVTYNILPTGTTIPAGINKTIDVNKNITKAVSQNANGIIINLPSNDAANSFPVSDQLHNYALIAQSATQAQIPLWVATPQPRSFGLNSTQAMIQNQMVTETYTMFQSNAVDFWTGLGNATGNALLVPYDSGDGVHATNEAHQIFFERLILQNIHGTVKNQVDGQLSLPDLALPIITLYPNPVHHELFIKTDLVIQKITIYNQLGQVVLQENHQMDSIDVQELDSGIYVVHLQNDSASYHYRMVKK